MKIEYDPLGRRITKTVGETVYHYTWSGDQLIEIRDGDGNLLKFIIYGNNLDEPIVMMGSATTYYFTTDGLGSISEITDEYGGLEEYYTYDAYGAPSLFDGTGTPISTSAANNPFYFTGREYDFETGIYYYRARYYDPALGRFLETDPLGYIDSLNLYAYVGNNPWNYIDPLGLCGEKNDFFQDVVDFYKNLGWQIITNLLTGGLTGGIPIERLCNPGNFNLQNNPAYFNGMGFSPETTLPPSTLTTPVIGGIQDVGTDFNAKGNKEETPKTNKGKFENVKGSNAKKNKENGEIWDKDKLHKNHFEVYKNKKDFDNGKRNRSVWDDGRLKEEY